MTHTTKLAAGAAFPAITVPRLGGGEIAPAAAGGWRLLIVYRGKHCPLCKPYLGTLDKLLEEFEAAGVSVAAISADPEEKAAADHAEFGWRFPLGYGLTVAQMQALGLYVSNPRSAQETDRPFAEPGLFLINPAGEVQLIDISNAPFARPDLAGIARGAKRIQEMNYPIRGTLV
ncbi:peroxiredoxin-like family protein [Falsiroseomonas tokyonensis]|uniref:Peroxiredoxin-like family protein n=1 Tax=Falsiroseomonas tokyonensis TaxID=430521 RepID=A0ABV7C5J0_9PROT|nr:peroxiredoxin-like family protein [Falsiroseomonas tokyonensis]MBU8541687.1 AhpC/TSA family protein [Falsiroseomonas tokyonensis]